MSAGDVGDRPSARCAPDRAAAAAAPAPAAGRGCGRAREDGGPSRGRASTRAAPPSSAATSPTVAIPRRRSFAAVTGPTPQSRSTGSGWRNASSPSGAHDEQAVGLGHAARHLGQELRPRDADGDRQTDPLAHVAPQPHRDLDGRAGDPLPCRARRGTPRRSRAPRRADVVSSNTANTALLASEYACMRGRDHDRLRAQPPGLPARPSPSGCRTPWPRSWPRARPRRRRSPGGRADGDRPVARPTRRTRRASACRIVAPVDHEHMFAYPTPPWN